MKHLIAVLAILECCPADRAVEPQPFPGRVSRWEGFIRHDFRVDGADVIVGESVTPGIKRVVSPERCKLRSSPYSSVTQLAALAGEAKAPS